MSETSILQEKRNELKRQLTTGKYPTLISRMFGGASRLVQRMSHASQPLPMWYGAVAISLILALIFAALPLLTGEADLYRALHHDISGVRLFAGGCLFIGLSFGAMLALQLRFQSMSTQLAEQLLDTLESEADLANLQQWLMAWTSIRKPLLAAVVYTAVIVPYNVVSLSSFLGVFIGIGGTYTQILTCMCSGIGIYYFFLFASFPVRIRKYRFKLFAADPGSSQAINCLLGVFNGNMYLLALILALNTLGFGLLGVLSVYGIVVVIAGWVPLIGIFVLHHSVLAQIITRAKWAMLYEIQAKIERLQAQADTLTVDILEQIEKLMDYHDRIAATRNSALNLRTSLSFVNSLLLPLLAFVLGNLDKILGVINPSR
jgi:hypothetical protein